MRQSLVTSGVCNLLMLSALASPAMAGGALKTV